jgi:transposase
MIIVGIDWARSKHDLVLMDASGQVIQHLQIPHDAEGIQQIAATIAEHEPEPGDVRIAIEMHDGALLAWLLEQGYTVFGINPKSAQRARDRYRPAGGKDDASDAFILADMLRTDRGSLRPIRPESDATVELRSLVELRASRVHERTALFHRLRARLEEW